MIKQFWSTVSPFISDKNKRADSKIILQEGEETIVDNLKVANVFNDYFCDIALNIGFDDSITSSCDAIAKHVNHPSVLKIKDMYKISGVLLVDGSDFPYLWYFHKKFLAKYVSLMFIVVMLFLSTLSLF